MKTYTTQFHPSAVILITGIPASGKSTMAKALQQRLHDYGIERIVRIDGEELRSLLPREYGYDLESRNMVFNEIVARASTELQQQKIVIISTIAHDREARLRARRELQPFHEVFLDCPMEICAARDEQGHYERARAGEYECFIGVTHAYEPSSEVELTLDTAATPPDECADRLARNIIDSLASPTKPIKPTTWRVAMLVPLMEWFVNSWIMSGTLKDSRWRNRAIEDAQGRQPIVSIRRRSCSQLFLLFGDISSFMGSQGVISAMDPLQFLRHSSLFGRNLTWIRDPYFEDFTRGVSEDISSEEQLIEWIHSYRASLPHVSKAYALGSSSGCCSALRFAHHLKLNEVWAFSPRTAKGSIVESRLRIKDLLSDHNGITQYHIWFAPKNRYDSEFAECLEPCPGVTLHPCPEFGSTHFLLRYLTRDNLLKNILPPFEGSTIHAEITDDATGSGDRSQVPYLP